MLMWMSKLERDLMFASEKRRQTLGSPDDSIVLEEDLQHFLLRDIFSWE